MLLRKAREDNLNFWGEKNRKKIIQKSVEVLRSRSKLNQIPDRTFHSFEFFSILFFTQHIIVYLSVKIIICLICFICIDNAVFCVFTNGFPVYLVWNSTDNWQNGGRYLKLGIECHYEILLGIKTFKKCNMNPFPLSN